MMNMDFDRKLTIPMEAKAMYPLSPGLAEIVAQRAAEIRDIITGRSDKLLLIIGPCSADNEDSVMEYLHRLRAVQERIQEKIFIIPRLYTNKPRTTGDGYMGLLHQPDPEEKPVSARARIWNLRVYMMPWNRSGFSSGSGWWSIPI